MVVDDNRLNRDLMQRMLIKMGHKADSAEDGQDCVNQLSKRPAFYDALFMDCDMPRMTGYDATKHIRQVLHDKRVVVVALTADATPEAKIRCLDAGMNDYFLKPITKSMVTVMLDKWFPHG